MVKSQAVLKELISFEWYQDLPKKLWLQRYQIFSDNIDPAH